jgi:hypothetical protein
VKEYLEFYSLDYTKSIYMPEVNIRPDNQLPREEITSKIGMSG